MIAPATLPDDALRVDGLDGPLPDEAVAILAGWMIELAEAGEGEEGTSQ